MTLWRQSSLALVTGACAALIAAGCGSGSKVTEVKGVTVSGVVLQNGKPLKFLKDETVYVTFASEQGGEAAVASRAEVKPEDGTFVIKGPTDQGIPAGRYSVGVSSEVYGGDRDRFASEEDGGGAAKQMTADVGSEQGQTFEIDVVRRTIKKKK